MITRKEQRMLVTEFEAALMATEREGVENLLNWIRESDFYRAPARTAHGCAFPGGLLKHTINVYHLLKEKLMPGGDLAWKKVAGDPAITSDTIAIVALLHDLCKTGIFVPARVNRKNYEESVVKKANPWEIKKDKDGYYIWEAVPGYKIDETIPLGKGEKSVILALRYIKLTEQEIYAIRWHRGALDADSNYEIGNVFASVPLAMALYEADLEATFLLDNE